MEKWNIIAIGTSILTRDINHNSNPDLNPNPGPNLRP